MRPDRRAMRVARILIPLVLLALAVAFPRLFQSERSAPAVVERSERTTNERAEAAGDRAIAEAQRDRRSGVWVESSGTVQRVLADDNAGSRHQRWILRLASGQTLLFAHNIDLAPRVPLDAGDRIRFRGQYEWNDRGGVVHWTHHDPAGLAGGWIERNGETYR